MTETMEQMRDRRESLWIAAAVSGGYEKEVAEIMEAALSMMVTDSLSERATLDNLLASRLARLRTKVEGE